MFEGTSDLDDIDRKRKNSFEEGGASFYESSNKNKPSIHSNNNYEQLDGEEMGGNAVGGASA